MSLLLVSSGCHLQFKVQGVSRVASAWQKAIHWSILRQVRGWKEQRKIISFEWGVMDLKLNKYFSTKIEKHTEKILLFLAIPSYDCGWVRGCCWFVGKDTRSKLWTWTLCLLSTMMMIYPRRLTPMRYLARKYRGDTGKPFSTQFASLFKFE